MDIYLQQEPHGIRLNWAESPRARYQYDAEQTRERSGKEEQKLAPRLDPRESARKQSRQQQTNIEKHIKQWSAAHLTNSFYT